MKIRKARIYALRIPLRNAFVHSLGKRQYSDSIVVRLVTDTGVTGFGEGVPREYVTGETVAWCMGQLQSKLLPALAHLDLPEGVGDGTGKFLSAMEMSLTDSGSGAVIAGNAAKTAVGLALIDCVLRQNGASFSAILKPAVDKARYSVVIPYGSVESARRAAEQCKQHAIHQIKVKVGAREDCARLAAVREIVGDAVSIRVDANCAFDVKGALSFIRSAAGLRIDSIEQPVPRDLGAMARVTAESPIPVMADESLVTFGDAEDLIRMKACNLFNLRLSKNGGIFSTLRIANLARQAGIGLQLGCQVGETAILSSAGRHVAMHLPDLKFIEGSYGVFLLEEDVSKVPVQFGYAGMAGPMEGPGLGIRVKEDVLTRFAQSIWDFG